MRGKMLLAIVGVAATISSTIGIARSGDIVEVRGEVGFAIDRTEIDGLSVEVNGKKLVLRANGKFSGQVVSAPYYQLRVSGERIYPSIHTFGHQEAVNRKCHCVAIPVMQVVARKPGRVELIFGGDAMAGRRFSEPIRGERRLVDPADAGTDISRLLASIAPYLEGADLASVNLESVLAESNPGKSPPKLVAFYSPSPLAAALSGAGVDYVTLGNNHVYDFMEPGLASTIASLKKTRLLWSGAGSNAQQARLPARVDVAGQPLSLLGFVGWKGNVEPNQVAEDHKGGAALGEDAEISQAVSREVGAGRIPIVAYHGGTEYSDEPTAEAERRMKLAVDSGAAVVASHHPHVPQGLELYHGKLIAYSLGNFLFDQDFPETHGSIMLRAWLDAGRLVRAEVIPIRILEYRPVPAVGSMRRAILARVARLSAKRNTHITVEAGHGVITPDQHPSGARLSASRSLVGSGCGLGGEPLFAGGDFENASFGDAHDRSVTAQGAMLSYQFNPAMGTVLELQPIAGAQSIVIAPTTNYRNVPGKRIMVCGRMRAQSPATVALLAGAEAGPGASLGTAKPPGAEASDRAVRMKAGIWQTFRFAEPMPASVSNRSIGFRLQISPSGGRTEFSGPVELDDLVFSVMPGG